MKLSELAKEIAGGVLKGDAEVRGLTADSRVVGEGDLFFCFQGKHVDSHVCAAEAQARGDAGGRHGSLCARPCVEKGGARVL